jgi:hypothetical protein
VSRPLFLADNDYDDDIVDLVLRFQPDVDIELARDVDLARAPDPEVLEFAAREGRIVLSHDRSTMIGFASQRVQAALRMPGLFISPQRLITPVAHDLLAVWGASAAEEWEGMIVHLPFKAVR